MVFRKLPFQRIHTGSGQGGSLGKMVRCFSIFENSLKIMFQEIDYLENTQTQKLVESLKNPASKCAILIMMDAGLRVSECISLRLSNFDFKAKQLKVKSLKKRTDVQYRIIPISDRLYEALATQIKSLSNTTPDSFLFPSPSKDGHHITRKALNQTCVRIKKKFPEFKRLHPHTLRHTCATQLLNTGAKLHEIKSILGHKSYDTTLIYSHIPHQVLKNRIDSATSKPTSFLDKIRHFIFPVKSTSLINISAEASNFIVGRNTELIQATELINKNCNVIFIGNTGIGKTHLLNQLTTSKKTIRFDDFSDLKKTFINALIFLYKGEKETIFKML
jgi:hypothetical protein